MKAFPATEARINPAATCCSTSRQEKRRCGESLESIAQKDGLPCRAETRLPAPMAQHTRHDAGIGAEIAQQDQRPDCCHSIGLAVMAPDLFTDGKAPQTPEPAAHHPSYRMLTDPASNASVPFTVVMRTRSRVPERVKEPELDDIELSLDRPF